MVIFGACFWFTFSGVVEVFINFYNYPVTYSVSVQHKNKVWTQDSLKNPVKTNTNTNHEYAHNKILHGHSFLFKSGP